jgi:hypothetical protein
LVIRWLGVRPNLTENLPPKSLCAKEIFLPGALTPVAGATYSATKWAKVG